MRGLMIEAAYGSVFIFTMIGYGIYWPLTHQSSTWATGVISYEFWYLLSTLSFSVGYSLLLEGGTRTEREKMCYQMNTSLLRDTIHNLIFTVIMTFYFVNTRLQDYIMCGTPKPLSLGQL